MNPITFEDALNVYTDGSSLQTPRRGGMGLRIIVINEQGEEEATDIPITGYRNSTNNSMEVLAPVLGIREALKHKDVDKYKKIAIFSDSKYFVDNYKTAIYEWSQHKWCNHNGKPVDNAKIWELFCKEYRKCQKLQKRVLIHWVKGHKKNPHNKAVDKSARASAEGFLNPALSIVKVRRKKSSQQVNIGSVYLSGQRLTIRIITDEYYPLQHVYKYKYEVMSEKSPYHMSVDIIYSELLLNAGHTYYVKINDDMKNPRIEKVYKEIKKSSF